MHLALIPPLTDPLHDSRFDHFLGGYPAILAFYDQNGQLVTMNNARGMGGTPIRLVSPAPIMFNSNGQATGPQGQSGRSNGRLHTIILVLVQCAQIPIESLQIRWTDEGG